MLLHATISMHYSNKMKVRHKKVHRVWFHSYLVVELGIGRGHEGFRGVDNALFLTLVQVSSLCESSMSWTLIMKIFFNKNLLLKPQQELEKTFQPNAEMPVRKVQTDFIQHSHRNDTYCQVTDGGGSESFWEFKSLVLRMLFLIL